MSARDTWWRHVLVLGGGAAAGQAIAIAAAPLLTRLYDAPAFGVFGLFNAVATTLGAVATLRFDQAIVLEPDEAQAGAVLRLSLLASLATAALTLLACLLFALLSAHPAARLLLAFCPLAVLAQGAFWSLSLWLTRAKLFRPLGLYQVARTGLGTAGQLGLAAVAAWPAMLVASQVAAQSLATTLLVAADRPRILAALRARTGLVAAARRHRRFALYGAPQTLLRLLSTNGPALLLPVLFGPAQSGLFWLAYRMLVLPQLVLVESTRSVFLRRAATLHEQQGDLRREMLVATGLIGLACLPAAALLIACGPALFALVFGPAWRGAGVFAAIIAAPWLIETMQMPAAILVAVLGRQRFYLAVELASLVARAAALLLGAAYGSAMLAVALYAAVWAISNLVVIATLAAVAPHPARLHPVTALGAPA